jgi:4-hydroxy-2-oxoheptanedioate aldolase
MAANYYGSGSAGFRMRRSRVLDKLRAGEIVNCFKINLDSVRVAEMAAMNGYDCIWIDVEHTASDWSLVESQIYAAKAWDCDSMVRVRRGAYSEYSVPLELDAAGLMVPHIMSVDDAKQVARMTRFAPIGLRAVDGGNADGLYCNLDLVDYLKQANENRFVIIQIEDPEALEQVEGICAVPGVDMIFFGPGDFSHAIGVPGDMGHPKVLEARKRIAEVALKHGKFAGTTGTLDSIEAKMAEGYRFFSLGADVVGLNPYMQENVDHFARFNKQLAASKTS